MLAKRDTMGRRLRRVAAAGVGLLALTAMPAAAQSPSAPESDAPPPLPLPPSMMSDFSADLMPDLPDLSTLPRADTKDDNRFVIIHSGHTGGVYYQVAAAICEALGATFEDHRIHCAAERTTGDPENAAALKSGEAEVALIQGDDNYRAAVGEADIGPARSIMSLFYESAVVVSQPEADVAAVRDLDGLTVNLGPDESAPRHLWSLLSQHGIAPEADAVVLTEYERPALHRLMCEEEIDAYVDWIGHPASYIGRTARYCNARVGGVPWTTTVTDLVERTPWLYHTVIPGGSYVGQDKPVETIGIRATLVARADTDDDIVYHITRAVLGDLERFRGYARPLRASSLTPMISEGNYLPFHAGAQRYFDEQGLPAAAGVDTDGETGAGAGADG
ncbi:TAXI family TRAP transporter solute-binding subunit [Caenispirillum salinarum]|uniref:TAXI family TRAP transporter solute-binding subunit n=1 Tax=Caenispirillum salinarum TaxID=859058 RepID=UPI00384CBA6F